MTDAGMRLVPLREFIEELVNTLSKSIRRVRN